jgi:acetoin utilization deacetylase AcuC-like enzyme
MHHLILGKGERLSQPQTAVAVIESADHFLPGHPESPDRFRNFDRLSDEEWAGDLEFVEPIELHSEQLELVHSAGYLDQLGQAVARGPGLLDFGDTYITQASFTSALKSAGAALAILDYIMASEGRRGFSLARPPGHHATAFRGMGFCLINNIALAAQHAINMGLERVMIIDFDVHHGNGTQDIFYDHPQVLYLSTHQRGIYPGTGAIEEIGTGAAQGTTINVPLPAFTGDAGFERIYADVIAPAARKFMPQILLISAGYDAHWQDPLAQLQITTQGFSQLAKNLVSLADELCAGRTLFVLEGGYNPESLFESVQASLAAMIGRDPPVIQTTLSPTRAEPDIKPILEAIIQTHRLVERD